MRAAWIAAALLAAAACSDTRGAGFGAAGSGSGRGDGAGHGHGHARKGPETELPRLTGWVPTCLKALETARAAAPFERFAILARGCPVCSVDWQPLMRANELDPNGTTAAHKLDVDAVVKACESKCTAQARDQFLAAFDLIKDETSLDRPWKRLAKECKDAMWPAPNDRFASTAWYILTQIGRAKLPLSAPLDLPLPAALVNGGGLALPIATAVLPEIPGRQISMMGDGVRVAPSPIVSVATDGLTLNVAEDFPGPQLVIADLDAQLAAVTGGKVAILAPYAAPAIHVLDVVRGVKTAGVELHLAAFVPGIASGWHEVPGMLPPVIRATPPTGDHVVLGVGGEEIRVGTVSGGALRGACADPAPLGALMHAKASADTVVVVSILDGATVEALAASIDAAATARLPSVTLAGSDAVKWPPDLVRCQ